MKESASKSKKTELLSYRIEPIQPAAHLFSVTLKVAKPNPGGQRLSLPTWIPGSYLIREFAKNIVEIEGHAGDGKRKVALAKVDKNTWQAEPVRGALVITYRVYAWDLSVRSAHLDQTHGFFNGTSVFLRVAGQENEPHHVKIVAPHGKAYADWRIATTLPEDGAKRYGFGQYRASNYDELVDHPVEMGTFRLAQFKAAQATHDLAITGRIPHLDVERICLDLQKICEAQIHLFEPEKRVAPFKRYLFLLTVLGDGYGGLEHRNSTALICSRDSLPASTGRSPGDSYVNFLGLVSHEYFHSWNVKRIKPQRFAPYDFDRENYTSLLWIFEGFTSYYDDLILMRTGLITADRYLGMLSKNLSEVASGAGRLRQSVAESSFDAWIKYYRQDENAGNAIVSYYKKGALIALALDLYIRAHSKGRRSLDDVMRALWRRLGREFYPANRLGLGEEEFVGAVAESTGIDVAREVRQWAYGVDDIPFHTLFAPFGIAVEQGPAGPGQPNPEKAAPHLGARVTSEGASARLASVSEGGPAQRSGLSAGDVLVAIDGLRVTSSNLETILGRYSLGQRAVVHAFRRDELLEIPLELDEPATLQWRLVASPGRHRLRRAWLS
ncbi:MAG: M61 family metallopeptidase [Burkholderiaceae bacterium]|jgi:predicted metalloprotease with PDZ domain